MDLLSQFVHQKLSLRDLDISISYGLLERSQTFFFLLERMVSILYLDILQLMLLDGFLLLLQFVTRLLQLLLVPTSFALHKNASIWVPYLEYLYSRLQFSV